MPWVLYLWRCSALRSSALSILWRSGQDRYGTLSWCAHLSKDLKSPNLWIFPPRHRRRRIFPRCRSRSALCWCRGNKIVEEHLPHDAVAVSVDRRRSSVFSFDDEGIATEFLSAVANICMRGKSVEEVRGGAHVGEESW